MTQTQPNRNENWVRIINCFQIRINCDKIAYINMNDGLLATIEALQDYIGITRWRTARDGSHQYTVVDWSPENEHLFRLLVKTILENGYQQRFMGTEYTYFKIGEYEYWNMNYGVEETILVNRRAVRPKVEDPNEFEALAHYA